MRRLSICALLIALVALSATVLPAGAQDYSFSLDREAVDVYWEADGTARLEYVFVFTNDPSGPPIALVDIGMPSHDYSLSDISGTVNGQAIRQVDSLESGDWVELNLGSNPIPPGASGTVQVWINRVGSLLYTSDTSGYASGVFSPSYFGRQFVHGTTDITVTFHLPPGVQPEEPRWHASPLGWPQQEPTTGYDSQGRIIYQWHNAVANGYTQYPFGADFPAQYVPSGVLQQPSIGQTLGTASGIVFPLLCVGLFIAVVGGWIVLAVVLDRRRRLAYLPPKIAIEGHGIKRGLTAVEAAVLLETPLDRVLTMMLFSVIKKNAARVVTETPLQIEKSSPVPEGLHDYETAFIEGAILANPRERQTALQGVVIDLVKSVQQKIKGFSLRESRDYYKAIMSKAWQEVEQAGTPEIRSQKFDEGLEWTMLDRDFDERTRRTFSAGPVFLPIWWSSYRPSTAGGSVSASRGAAPLPSRPASTGGGVSVPHLPGSDFAASLLTGVRNTAGGLVASVTGFTGGVASKTNPPPPPPKTTGGGWKGGGWTGGGGHACACACACAGCACACAGGGR